MLTILPACHCFVVAVTNVMSAPLFSLFVPIAYVVVLVILANVMPMIDRIVLVFILIQMVVAVRT